MLIKFESSVQGALSLRITTKLLPAASQDGDGVVFTGYLPGFTIQHPHIRHQRNNMRRTKTLPSPPIQSPAASTTKPHLSSTKTCPSPQATPSASVRHPSPNPPTAPSTTTPAQSASCPAHRRPCPPTANASPSAITDPVSTQNKVLRYAGGVHDAPHRRVELYTSPTDGSDIPRQASLAPSPRARFEMG